MSKIGRKPIEVSNVQVEIKGQDIHLKGKKGLLIHSLPSVLKAELNDKKIKILCENKSSDANVLWGLHRALLANEVKGIDEGFEQKVIINGLGFKALVSGPKVVFTLGFSHKIELAIPAGLTVETDKTGQNVTIKGTDKESVGFFASKIRELRPPEPYKGTGIRLANEVILRKAGKTKSA
jgi:large subunit ribosomal protein L6